MYKPNVDGRQRSHSAKAYLGCDTCKLKNCEVKKVKSINKFNDCNNFRNVKKTKKAPPELEKDRGREMRKTKIKLTDLCDEDKKRIIELIEELSRFADKNQQLKESLECSQKTRLEQQDYIIQQAKTHLEEKNFYVSEINRHKLKVEALEYDLKSKVSQWEKQERFMDNEIAYLAKALQKSLKEKNELNEQVNQMSICLRQSLEAFQKLRVEVNALQLQEQQQIKKLRSVSCQTEQIKPSNIQKDKYMFEEDTEEEEECNRGTANSKSSLDIINDKLEHVYQLLKRKSDSLTKNSPKKFDVDLSDLLKNRKLAKEGSRKPGNCPEAQDDETIKEESQEETGYKFLKPFDQSSKASVQADKMFKKIGNPLSLIVNECPQKFNRNKFANFNVLAANFLQTNVHQKNDLIKPSEDHHYDEDRLLEELFYSDRNVHLDSVINPQGNELEV